MDRRLLDVGEPGQHQHQSVWVPLQDGEGRVASMQAPHLGLVDEAGLSRRIGKHLSDLAQALLGHAAPERFPCLGHEVCNHAPSLKQLIHGRNAVLDAARAGRVIKVYPAARLGHRPRRRELARLAVVEEVPKDRLDAMAPGVNQGVAAELKPRRDWTLDQLLKTNASLLVALDSILDPQNLAAILRSAEVAAADGPILPHHPTPPLSPAAVTARSAATELLPIAKVSGLPSAI